MPQSVGLRHAREPTLRFSYHSFNPNDIGILSNYTEIALRLRRNAMTLSVDSESPCALCEPNEVRRQGG